MFPIDPNISGEADFAPVETSEKQEEKGWQTEINETNYANSSHRKIGR